MSREFLVAFGICIATIIGACDRSVVPSEQQDVLRRALGGEPSTLDPAAAADNFSTEVLRDLYEGLTAESPTGEVVPGVASSWTVDATGREYTFKLRTDARWSNGKRVRALDFVNAMRRVTDPKQGSPVADDLRFLTGASSITAGKIPVTDLGVYAPNDDILIVKLEHPVPFLPQLLSHAAAYPIYSESSATSHDPARVITNGPYSLASWSPSTSIRLTRNEQYWDHSNVHIPRVDYLLMTDENAQYAGFRAGQVDMTDTVPPSVVPVLRAQHSAELVLSPFLATAYYGLNLTKAPFSGNSKLRQALAMAIDRKKVVDALAAGQAEAFSFVPPGTANYSPETWEWKELSDAERLGEARHLYAEAGYSVKSPLHLRLLLNSNVGIRNTAIIVASMWKDVLGIDTELFEEEYRVFLQSRHDKTRWEVLRLGWTADYNDASNFLDAFRRDSENNDEGYSSPGFDALLDQAAQTEDLQKRRSLLETSEKMLLADYPIVPLYFFVSKRLVKPYIRGLQSNPLNHIPSKSLLIGPH